MTEQFANFSQSTLSVPITASQTTISIATPVSGQSFPSQGNFRIVVQSFDVTTQIPTSAPEIMLVTAVAGNVFTVQRGAESTKAIAFASGAMVTHIVTAGVMQALSGGGSSPLTTKGDLYGFSTVAARVPVGADGTVLSADSTQPTGLKYIAVGGTGTVTNVSVTTANGVSGSVATATTTPAITLTLGAITPSSVNASGTVAGSNLSGTNTGDQTITLTGDASGSGTGSFATTLATVNGNVGSFTNASITVNAKGLITAAANGSGGSGTVTTTGSPANGNLAKFSGATSVTNADLTGDITTSGTVATTLATVNANVGTFVSTTVNAKGLVTAASNLTGDITSSGAATTLATVNSNVGSFTAANITVNAKGLITAASNGSGGGTTVNINTLQIDQTPASGTYGTLAGTVNGSNAIFTVSNNAYVTGSLMVFLNGQEQTQGGSNDWTETTPASGTFTFVTAPPSGSILQAAYIKTSSASGIATVPIATITGVNAKTTGGTLSYTSPSTKSTVITAAIVRCTAATAITVGPSCSVGTTAGATDIFASVAITALTTTSKIYGFALVGMSVIVPPNGTVYFNVDVAATGTSQVLAVDFEGYQV